MAKQIVDFVDMQNAVIEELKIQSSDTVTIERIKRDINMGYIQEVVPYKRWWWLVKSTNIIHKSFWPIGSITVSVTPDSDTVTFSSAPAASLGSFKGFKFSVEGFDEIYTIDTHTANSTTATLTTTYQGTLAATATFKVWKDSINLPTDCRETIEAAHDRNPGQLEPVGFQEMRRRRATQPKVIGFPQMYTTHTFHDPTPDDGETEDDRIRQMLFYPSISRENVTMHIDYIKEVTALDDDSDEPLIPVEDRMVLVYYALSRAWQRDRNPEAAQYNFQLFQRKLDRMAGDVEDSIDTPSISPVSTYIRSKRGPRLRLGGRGKFIDSASGGGSGNANISFLKDVTIEGATVTAAIAVNDTITIDGRDISVDGTTLDDHIAASSGVHGVTGSVVGTSDVQTLTNKAFDATANTLTEISNANIATDAAIARSKLADGTADHVLINDASGVMSSEARLDLSRSPDGTANQVLIAQGVGSDPAYSLLANANIDASAAIEVSKFEALTANRIVETDASGFLQVSDITDTELDFLNDVEAKDTATLTDNTTGGTVDTFADSFDLAIYEYALTRGTAYEGGHIYVMQDGTNVDVSPVGVSRGTTGVTFSGSVAAGTVTVLYDTTSTGNDADMAFKLIKLAST